MKKQIYVYAAMGIRIIQKTAQRPWLNCFSPNYPNTKYVQVQSKFIYLKL